MTTLAAPTGLTVTTQGSARLLTWDTAPAGVDGTAVWRRVGAGPYRRLSLTTATSFTDQEPHPTKTVKYMLQAYARPNLFSAFSAEVTVTGASSSGDTGQVDTTPPTNPPNFAAVGVSTSAIQLSWGASTDSQSGLGGYNLYREGLFVTTLGPTVNSYTDSNLGATSTHNYGLEAFDTATPVNTSARVSASATTQTPVITVANPGTPGQPTAVISGNNVSVTFGASTPGTYPILGYEVWRKVGAGSYAQIGTTPVNSFTDSNITTLGYSQTVQYELKAYDNQLTPNKSGFSAASAAVTTPAAPASNTTLPVTPFVLPPAPAVGSILFKATQAVAHHDGTTPGSPILSYPWKRGAAVQSPDIPLPSGGGNALGIPTLYNIGSVSPAPVATRNGIDWILSAAGPNGIDSPSDQCGLIGWAYPTAALPVVAAKIAGLTGPFTNDYNTVGNYAQFGVGYRESSSQGAKYLYVYITPLGWLFVKWRPTTGGGWVQRTFNLGRTNANPCCVPNASGGIDVYINDGSTTTLVTTLTAADLTLGATGIAGLLTASLTATAVSASFSNVIVAPPALLTQTVASTVTESFNIAARNANGTGTYSPTASATPTTAGGGGGGGGGSSVRWIGYGNGVLAYHVDGGNSLASMKSDADHVNGQSNFARVTIILQWKDVEPTQGTIDNSLIAAMRAYCAGFSNDVRIGIAISTFKFGGSISPGGGQGNILPDYVIANGWYFNNTGVGYGSADWSNASMRAAYANMLMLLGQSTINGVALKDDDRIVLVTGDESANIAQPYYTGQVDAIRAAFPNTVVLGQDNYINPTGPGSRDFSVHVDANGEGDGGPDAMADQWNTPPGTSGQLAYRGAGVVGGNDFGSVNYEQRVAYYMQSQVYWGYNAAQTVAWVRTLQATHFDFVVSYDPSGNGSLTAAALIAAVNASPTGRTARPTSLP